MVKTGLLIFHPPALTSMGGDFKLIGFYFGARRPLASAWQKLEIRSNKFHLSRRPSALSSKGEHLNALAIVGLAFLGGD